MKISTSVVLALLCLITGMNASAGDFTVNSVNTVKYVKANKAFAVSTNVTNGTTEKITSVAFTVTPQGQESYTVNQDLNIGEQIKAGQSTELYLLCQPIITPGQTSLNITLNKVNNIDLSANNTLTSGFEVVETADTISVMDEVFAYGEAGPTTNTNSYKFLDVPADDYFRWDLAVIITPETAPELVGKTLTGIRADKVTSFNFDLGKHDFTNYRLYCTEVGEDGLPDMSRQIENTIVTYDKNHLLQTPLAKPIKFTDQKLAFCLSLDIKDNFFSNKAQPMLVFNPVISNIAEDYIYRNPETNGWKVNNEEKTFWKTGEPTTFALPIMVTYEGDSIPPAPIGETRNAQVVNYLDSPTATINRGLSRVFRVKNLGTDTITELHYTYTVDGGAPISKTCGRPIPPMNTEPYYIWFAFDPIATTGLHKIEVTVDSVDGFVNICRKNKAVAEITFYDEDSRIPADAKSIDWIHSQRGRWLGHGDGSTLKHGEIAMKLNDPRLDGMEVVAMRACWFRGGNKNYKVWTSSKLGNLPDGEVHDGVEVDENVLAVFDKPIKLGTDDVYFGCSYDRDLPSQLGDREYSLPFIYTGKFGKKDNLWIKTDDSGWLDYSTEGTAVFKFYLRGNFPAGDVMPIKDEGLHTAAIGDTCIIDCVVQNNGLENASTLTYVYSIDGKEYTRTCTLEEPLEASFLRNQSTALPLDGFGTDGTKEINVAITQVNGNPNKSIETQMPVKVTIAKYRPNHRPLMEEGTGTWCGWCPRGVAGMYHMAKKYPDFIGVAYHWNDIMDPKDKEITTPFFGNGRPCATIDRGKEIDPYFGSSDNTPLGISLDYDKAVKNIAPAFIGIKTTWDEAKEKITVETTTNFIYTEPHIAYRIACVATVDGLEGTGEDWKQSNGYEGNTEYMSEPYLKNLVDGSINCNIYNHVVMAGNNIGIENSIPATMKVGEPNVYTYEIDCTKYAHYDSSMADDVHVVAFITDSNGLVRNAISAKAGESAADEVAINDITIDKALSATYYDLQGRRITNPQHGIFIKKQGNKATKVVK